MRCPDGWTILNETLWHIPAHEAHLFWQALARARWTRARTFRQAVQLLGSVRIDIDHFVKQTCSPGAVIHLIEELRHEKQLRDIQARRLAAYILAQVDEHGNWCGDVWDGQAHERILPDDVTLFAEVGTA